MAASDNLSPDQFPRGSRVQHKASKKTGKTWSNVHRDGTTYVKWDGSSRAPSAVGIKNLRVVDDGE